MSNLTDRNLIEALSVVLKTFESMGRQSGIDARQLNEQLSIMREAISNPASVEYQEIVCDKIEESDTPNQALGAAINAIVERIDFLGLGGDLFFHKIQSFLREQSYQYIPEVQRELNEFQAITAFGGGVSSLYPGNINKQRKAKFDPYSPDSYGSINRGGRPWDPMHIKNTEPDLTDGPDIGDMADPEGEWIDHNMGKDISDERTCDCGCEHCAGVQHDCTCADDNADCGCCDGEEECHCDCHGDDGGEELEPEQHNESDEIDAIADIIREEAIGNMSSNTGKAGGQMAVDYPGGPTKKKRNPKLDSPEDVESETEKKVKQELDTNSLEESDPTGHYDDEVASGCARCGGKLAPQSQAGKLIHYRCTKCGLDTGRELAEKSPKTTSLTKATSCVGCGDPTIGSHCPECEVKESEDAYGQCPLCESDMKLIEFKGTPLGVCLGANCGHSIDPNEPQPSDVDPAAGVDPHTCTTCGGYQAYAGKKNGQHVFSCHNCGEKIDDALEEVEESFDDIVNGIVNEVAKTATKKKSVTQKDTPPFVIKKGHLLRLHPNGQSTVQAQKANPRNKFGKKYPPDQLADVSKKFKPKHPKSEILTNSVEEPENQSVNELLDDLIATAKPIDPRTQAPSILEASKRAEVDQEAVRLAEQAALENPGLNAPVPVKAKVDETVTYGDLDALIATAKPVPMKMMG